MEKSEIRVYVNANKQLCVEANGVSCADTKRPYEKRNDCINRLKKQLNKRLFALNRPLI